MSVESLVLALAVLVVVAIVVIVLNYFFYKSSNAVFPQMVYPIKDLIRALPHLESNGNYRDYEFYRSALNFLGGKSDISPVSLHKVNVGIRVFEDLASCESAVLLLKIGMIRSRYFFLGFDCEWRPNNSAHQNPVALIQLATLDGIVCLFRLCKMGIIPECLKEVLEDPMVYKVGVGSCTDARLLTRDYGITMRGVLDLRHLTKLLGENVCSLSKMSKRYLGIELNKRLACSRWDRHTLTREEIHYAALDAYVGIHIFYHLTRSMWPRMVISCRGSTFCDNRLPTKILSVCDGFCCVRKRCDQRIGRDF